MEYMECNSSVWAFGNVVHGVLSKRRRIFSRVHDKTWRDVTRYDIWHGMKWHYMIWYDMTRHDKIWYDIWYDMTWHYIWYDMTWHDIIWYDMIWHDMTRYDMICQKTVTPNIYIYIHEGESNQNFKYVLSRYMLNTKDTQWLHFSV